MAATVFFRHTEDGAGLHAVDVAPDEGIGIGAIEAHQHLLEGDAFVLILGRDLAQGFPLLHHTGAGSLRFFLFTFRDLGLGRRLGFRLGRRLLGLSFLRGRLDHRRSGLDLAAALHRRHGFRLGHRYRLARRLGGHFRRIQEEGVFPHQTAGRPIELHQEIQEGLVNRLGRSDADHGRAVGALVQGETQIRQGGDVIHASLPEGILGCQMHPHAGEFVAGGADFHLGPEWLPQVGENSDFAQARGLDKPRSHGKTGSHGNGRSTQSESRN